jgi:hypothetical protein
MPKNLGQKGLTGGVKICVKIMPDFISKGSNGCQNGYNGFKTEPKQWDFIFWCGDGRCSPALADLRAGNFRSLMSARGAIEAVELGRPRAMQGGRADWNGGAVGR